MREKLSSVSPKGQVTLPIEIRRMLGVKPRDKVAFSVENGEVRITPVHHTLESVAGSVEPPTRTEDFEHIIQESHEEVADRVAARLTERR